MKQFVILSILGAIVSVQAQSSCFGQNPQGQSVNGVCFDALLNACGQLNLSVAANSNCPFNQQCCYLGGSWIDGLQTTTMFPPSQGPQFCGISSSGFNPLANPMASGGMGNDVGIFQRESLTPRMGRILGGTPVTDLYRYCWIAAINVGNNYLATGSIINQQYILTTASALKNIIIGGQVSQAQLMSLSVRLGQTNFQGSGSGGIQPANSYRVQRVVVHPGYRVVAPGFPINDVALLQLANTIDFGTQLCTACLPDQSQSFVGERCHAAGYGSVQEGSNNIDGQLRSVLLPFIPRPVCDNVYRRLLNNQFYQTDLGSLCAGGETGKDTCLRDGGAPLTCVGVVRQYYVLAGISSWGAGCGRYGVPSVYADISNPTTLNWIQNTVGAVPPRPSNVPNLPREVSK